MMPPLTITRAQQEALAEALDRAFRDRLTAAYPDLDAAAVEARLSEAQAAGFDYEEDVLAFFAIHAALDGPDGPSEGAALARAILDTQAMPAADRIAAAREAVGMPPPGDPEDPS